MLAERFVLRTDREGRLAGLPVFPPNEEVEIIVLRKEPALSSRPAQPSQKLRGSATWIGDTTAPVYDEAELDGIEAEMEQEWRELYISQKRDSDGHP
ncbi:MAG: hypothetical protein NTX45_13860 [Proteobacteria bacterium]|nr:hypothetical protein [Pseudomonadota bacterium]